MFLQMTVTWTSGYNIDEAAPFVEWGKKGESHTRSPAGTLTFTQNDMCGKSRSTCFLPFSLFFFSEVSHSDSDRLEMDINLHNLSLRSKFHHSVRCRSADLLMINLFL